MKSRHLIEKEYSSKIKELKKYNRLYYDESNPAISDSDYDKLKKDIVELENNFNYLKSNDSPSISWPICFHSWEKEDVWINIRIKTINFFILIIYTYL